MLLLFVALCTIANAQGMEDAMNNRQSDFLISKTYSVGDIYNENGVIWGYLYNSKREKR